jgi:hypothetical protein
MMLRTRMFSLTPSTPGRRQQYPRMIRSICTPACEARYRWRMICASTSELALIMIRPFHPTLFLALMNCSKFSRKLTGATRNLRYVFLFGEAGERVKQLRGVGTHLLILNHDAQIGIDARRDRVVVARCQMEIAAQPFPFAPHHEQILQWVFSPITP